MPKASQGRVILPACSETPVVLGSCSGPEEVVCGDLLQVVSLVLTTTSWSTFITLCLKAFTGPVVLTALETMLVTGPLHTIDRVLLPSLTCES